MSGQEMEKISVLQPNKVPPKPSDNVSMIKRLSNQLVDEILKGQVLDNFFIARAVMFRIRLNVS
jgi:hypothetical protein